jgi:hypothetical protein
MFSSNAYAIRVATPDDEPVLRALAALDSRPALGGPALIGEIDRWPAAALSPADGRLVAVPFQPTAQLAVHLRCVRRASSRTSASRRSPRASAPPSCPP